MISGRLYRTIGSDVPLFDEKDVIVSRVQTNDILIYISTEITPKITLVKVIHQDVIGYFKFVLRLSNESDWFQEVCKTTE